jgi:hypothetical protein
MHSFGREVKPEELCRKILNNVEELFEVLLLAKFVISFASSSCFATR